VHGREGAKMWFVFVSSWQSPDSTNDEITGATGISFSMFPVYSVVELQD
jgi:hypothetical protein